MKIGFSVWSVLKAEVLSRYFHLLLLQLLHPVERRAGLEPFDLLLIHGVVQLDSVCTSVLMVQFTNNGLKQLEVLF